MPAASDGATTISIARYHPDVLRLSDGERWSIVGGIETDDEIHLHMLVAHPTEPALSERFVLIVPFNVEGDTVVVGPVRVGEQ